MGAWCRNSDQTVLHETPHAQFGCRGPTDHDSHVEIVADDALGNIVDRTYLKLQFVCRVSGSILREQRRQQIQSGRSAGAKPNASHCTARHFMHAIACTIDRREDPARLFEHDLTRDGERDAPCGAIEQPSADLLLELRDLVRDRWLREAACRGRPREVPQLGDGDEGLQKRKVHR